ncbi:hypothetical protein [Burkholderia diffusa]|uniref:hypothetical protein n=1 Tax=Burkholderia diffusa TaxID=488732 RepID=UPI0012D874BE|nr:hypothetical protein [Burkholderia diffusa]
MKKYISVVISCLAVGACAAVASPYTNRYPNLNSAQGLIDQSIQCINQAQVNNREKFGNHAERAKTLLREARAELDQAAIYHDQYAR